MAVARPYPRSPVRAVSFGAAIALMLASALYVIFGHARSIMAVPAIVRHIPLNSQGFIIIPRLSDFLQQASAFSEESVRLTNSSALSSGMSSGASMFDTTRLRLRSAFSAMIEGVTAELPVGCTDFKKNDDLKDIGINASTSAAIIFDRYQQDPWETAAAFAIGPVDREQFSSFLATATLQKRYVVRFSVSKTSERPTEIQITQLNNLGNKLCILDGNKRDLVEGGVVSIPPAETAVFSSLEIRSGLEQSFDFSASCSVVESNDARSCNCTLFELGGDGPLQLGDCSSKTRASSPDLSKFQRVYSSSYTGEDIGDGIALMLPIFGAPSLPADTVIKWDETTRSLLIGPAKLLAQSPAYSGYGVASSIVRNDAFMKFFDESGGQRSAFVGSFRPDVLSGGEFDRLISLPMQFSGTMSSHGINISAAINMEPLDAGILQDMSREGPPLDSTEIPIVSSLEGTSLRVQDEKIGQLVRFADQYVFDRLVEEKVALNLDPLSVKKLEFVRYLFRKMGFNDEPAQVRAPSFPAQAQQIMLFAEDPDDFVPGVAVAIKFETIGNPHDFICGEFQRFSESVDRRILFNAAREAKRKVSPNDDLGSYAADLNDEIERLIGSEKWQRFSQDYDFDSVNFKIRTRRSVMSDQACESIMSREFVGEHERTIYVLTPKLEELLRRYYYLVPLLLDELAQRQLEFDQKIKADQQQLPDLQRQVAPFEPARDALRRINARNQRLPDFDFGKADEEDVRRLNVALSQAGLEQAPGAIQNLNALREWMKKTGLTDRLQEALRNSQEIDRMKGELTELVKNGEAERAMIERVVKHVDQADDQAVAAIDSSDQVVFLASNRKALSKALTLTSRRDQSRPDHLLERVRLLTSIDDAVGWVLRVSGSDDADSWRQAQRDDGTILPWRKMIIGVSSSHNVINLSLSLTTTAASQPQ
jgi:hypothetical protein